MEILLLEVLALSVGGLVVWGGGGGEDVISPHQKQLSEKKQGTGSKPRPNTSPTPQL